MVTQADIDNLNAAIASGTRQVTIGGQTVLYQTTESLIKARDTLASDLARSTGTKRSRQTSAYYAGRGYHSDGT